jgi:2-polyprenyl-3-methyl-5-hydroxy-6-metoxy-1,4-benzoquinol methylase
MTEGIVSPLSGRACKPVRTLPSRQLVELYRNELQLDVSKYFMNIPEVTIFECPESGYRFYFPLSIFGDAEFYAELEKKSGYYPEWKWENETAEKLIATGASVLDIGCGNGSFIREMIRRKKIVGTGIDTNTEAIAFAKMQQLGEFAASEAGSWSRTHENQYDIVTCFQVLEHISDPLPFLEDAIRCLRENGQLIIAVPNNIPYLYRHDVLHPLNLPPHHAGLWNSISLSWLENRLPLKKESISVQPIGDQLNYYEMIQLENLRSRFSLLNNTFVSRLFTPVYGKLLRLRKNKIPGHSVLIVFSKQSKR